MPLLIGLLAIAAIVGIASTDSEVRRRIIDPMGKGGGVRGGGGRVVQPTNFQLGTSGFPGGVADPPAPSAAASVLSAISNAAQTIASVPTTVQSSFSPGPLIAEQPPMPATPTPTPVVIPASLPAFFAPLAAPPEVAPTVAPAPRSTAPQPAPPAPAPAQTFYPSAPVDTYLDPGPVTTPGWTPNAPFTPGPPIPVQSGPAYRLPVPGVVAPADNPYITTPTPAYSPAAWSPTGPSLDPGAYTAPNAGVTVAPAPSGTSLVA